MDFKKAFTEILELEGGYVNDPDDPGGETNFGISKRSYPNLDIKNLSKGEAMNIYLNDYWAKLSCDLIPEPLRLMAFDCGVNQGVSFAKSCMGKVKFGNDSREMVMQFSFLRSQHYFSNPNFNIYGHGWIRRLIRITLRTIC